MELYAQLLILLTADRRTDKRRRYGRTYIYSGPTRRWRKVMRTLLACWSAAVADWLLLLCTLIVVGDVGSTLGMMAALDGGGGGGAQLLG